MARRAVILTEEVLASIPAMIEQGLRRAEIAERLGCTEGTLQVQCSRRGISLRKGGPFKKALTLPLLEVQLALSREAMAALRERAQANGWSEVKLASDLLEIIARDDLYDAVLDR
jgi:hypothetical protein